jgi:competence protein ComGC
MTFSECSNGRNAFTLLELFILIALLAILAAILLPALRPAHVCCYPNCANNLKQIGLAFKTWALDNGDRFPMSVSTNEGGTMELCAGPNAFAHFAVMSNELSTPAVLVCPEDKKRHWATNFDSDLNNSKLSYFVDLDASSANLPLLLSGDRNLTNNSPSGNGIFELRMGDKPGWTHELHKSKGHLLLADGSVQLLSNGTFRVVLPSTVTNRLAMP